MMLNGTLYMMIGLFFTFASLGEKRYVLSALWTFYTLTTGMLMWVGVNV